MWLACVGVAAATVATLIILAPKARTVPLFFFFLVAIPLEERLSKRGWCWRHRFPRSPAELQAAPRRFFDLLRDSQLRVEGVPEFLPRGCRLADACLLDAQTTEPDKNAVSVGLRLKYHASAEEEEEVQPGAGTLSSRHADVFVKFQCGRGLKLWLQALRSAMNPGLQREVLFYQHLAHRVPQRVARPFYAGAVHWCNRICLVLEHLGDATVVPDWAGGSEAQLRAVAVNVAAMHAKWWGRTADDPATCWIPARSGLEYAKFVTGFLSKEPPRLQELWAALQQYFAQRPVTLIHGDCRLGNMMFPTSPAPAAADPGSSTSARVAVGKGSGGSEARAAETDDIIFSDWEAVNVGPALWDIAYLSTLSQTSENRRVRTKALLSAYLAALRKGGVSATECSDEDAHEQLGLLQLVLFFVSYVVAKHELWAGQGNTTRDGSAWSLRVTEAVADLIGTAASRKRVAAALSLPVEHLEALHGRVVHGLEAAGESGKGADAMVRGAEAEADASQQQEQPEQQKKTV